jgi:hypothetical protein
VWLTVVGQSRAAGGDAHDWAIEHHVPAIDPWQGAPPERRLRRLTRHFARDGHGFWLVSANGKVIGCGSMPNFYGSTGNIRLNGISGAS